MNDEKRRILAFFNIMRNRGIFAFFNRFFRGNVHKKCHNCKKSGSDLESRYIICQVNHNNSSSFISAKTLSLQKIIAPSRLNINTLKSLVKGIATKNTATRFEQTAENTFSWAVVMLNTYPTLTRKILPVNKVRNSLTQQGFIKLTKKTLISTFILWFVILGSGLIYLFNPFTTRTAEAAWFNDNWGLSI